MIIEIDNTNCNNDDINLTQEELDALFSDISGIYDVNFISWEFERKLRKRNIL